jgi:hypothetical protein
MKPVWKMLLFGFLVWLIPFVVAFSIFQVRNSDRPLFESIMPVVISVCVVLFSVLYFKKQKGKYLKDGIVIGFVWLAISIAIDLLMFMQGPMKMDFVDYVKDIGITYLMIPIITIGMGYLVEKQKTN